MRKSLKWTSKSSGNAPDRTKTRTFIRASKSTLASDSSQPLTLHAPLPHVQYSGFAIGHFHRLSGTVRQNGPRER